MKNSIILFIFALLWQIPAKAQQSDLINHKLDAKVIPASSYIEVTDEITVPEKLLNGELRFLLHEGMKLSVSGNKLKIRKRLTGVKADDVGMDREVFEDDSQLLVDEYIVMVPDNFKGNLKFKIRYSGKIDHPLEQVGEEYARGFSQTPGTIGSEGIYLAGATYWIPYFNENLFTYELTVHLPAGWKSVSQGERTFNDVNGKKHIDRWLVNTPAEEVYLIGAKFTEYEFNTGSVLAMAFLRTPDENLANKYLETTAQYLDMYRKMIGPYPYSKFALVENFWETGYGMPSFTLLGEKIIRFPFILHSSYPHELLHNWWGNGVYVDFSKGNWCEGMTVYGADHLIKEQRGQGTDYRRSTLQKFTDYVNPKNDFPLTAFRSRTNPSSEAIGYGKSMMLWHMLRRKIGDDNFLKGLQNFYRKNKFRRATFDDIRKAFEEVTDQDFSAFFRQWTTRKGAPRLKLNSIKTDRNSDHYNVRFNLEQTQTEAPFVLEIPVIIRTSKEYTSLKIEMNEKDQSFSIDVKDKPYTLEIDPEFDVFRKLDPNEIPPALSKIFGSDSILILLPADAPDEIFGMYAELGEKWAKESRGRISVGIDRNFTDLPADKGIWLLGWENNYLPEMKKWLNDYNIELNDKSVRINKTVLTKKDNSFVITAGNPRNPAESIALLTIHSPEAVSGLARKLPHYGKYSYLAFSGEEPANVAKGQWPSVHSPLTAKLADDRNLSSKVKRAKRRALAYLAPVFSADKMKKDIEYLASEELKGRGIDGKEIEKAAEYIAAQMKEAGLLPGGDNGTYFQEFTARAGKDGKKVTIKNVVGYISGTKDKLKNESVVISAHYDHLGLGWPDVRKGNEGKIHYGADDNASGVAVLLSLARAMGKTAKPARAIVFAAFTGEEAGLLGSRYFVKHSSKFPAKKIIADINLDTVGRLGKNKLMVLNGSTAKEWKYIFMFSGFSTGVETEMVSEELDASDQVAFIEAGIPAVQIFSGPNADYHRPTDTADKIDYDGMLKAATITKEAIEYLADREEKLSFNRPGKNPAAVRGASAPAGKRASTGTIPDFTFSGSGVRLSGVTPGSPAQKAGMQKGDVIVEFAGEKVTGLREYSGILKKHKPGETVTVKFIRGGEEKSAKLKLAER